MTDIVDKIEQVTALSKDCGSLEKALTECAPHLEEIRMFQDVAPTAEECLYLCLLVSKGFNENAKLTGKNLASHLGCLGIQIIPSISVLNILFLNGMVERVREEAIFSRASYSASFYLNTIQLGAFLAGKLGTIKQSRKVARSESFFSKIKQYNHSLSRGEVGPEEYRGLILQFFQINQTLPLCNRLLTYMSEKNKKNILPDDLLGHTADAEELRKELILLILLAEKAEYLEAELNIKSIIEEVFQGEYEESSVLQECLLGIHHLFVERYLGRSDLDIFNDGEEFQFTPKFYLHILGKKKGKKDHLINLDFIDTPLSYKKIKEKPLWFNEPLEKQLGEIKSLLVNTNFKKASTILKKQFQRKAGFTILFHGDPGTGKTEFVYQVARETHRELFKVDMSALRSMWYGKTEKQVKEAFDEYRSLCEKKRCLPIMFMNEADAIVGKRVQVERTVDQTHNTLQNILLEELENFEGILICTTNLIHNLDKAFERRFMFKIAFDMPNATVQAQIWQHHFPQLSVQEINQLTFKHHLSPAQISNIAQKSALQAILGKPFHLESLHDFALEESLIKSNPIGY